MCVCVCVCGGGGGGGWGVEALNNLLNNNNLSESVDGNRPGKV